MLLRLEAVLLVIVLSTAIAVARNVDAAIPSDAYTPIHVASETGSDAQRLACTPDVFRLCGRFIPDVDGIVACLKLQRPNLSPPCRAVFH